MSVLFNIIRNRQLIRVIRQLSITNDNWYKDSEIDEMLAKLFIKSCTSRVVKCREIRWLKRSVDSLDMKVLLAESDEKFVVLYHKGEIISNLQRIMTNEIHALKVLN